MSTEQAAQLLGITPHQLAVWSKRFRHPAWHTGGDGQRVYNHGEVHALRRALDRSSSISAAMAIAYAERRDNNVQGRD